MNWRSELQTDMARLEAEAQRAWGPFLLGYQWHHWLTLTTRTPWTWERLSKEFENKFVRYATKATLGPVPYFYAIEGGVWGDRPHVHALLYGTATLSSARLKAIWSHGRTAVDAYDQRRGAAYYVSKDITGPVLHYDVSTRRPPLLTRGACSTAFTPLAREAGA